MANEFVLPEDLTTVDAAQLEKLLAEARSHFEAVTAAEDPNAETLQAATALAAAIKELAGEQKRRSDEKDQNKAALAALAAEVADPEASSTEPDPDGTKPEGTPDGGAGEPGTSTDPATPPAEGTPPAEPATDPATPAGTPEPAGAGAAVTAAGNPTVSFKAPRRINVPAAEVRARAPQVDPEKPNGGLKVMVASGDVPGFSLGQEYGSLTDVAKGMHARARGLADGQSAAIAKISTVTASGPDQGGYETVHEGMDPETIEAALDRASAVDVLVASGGWCAPSQVMYDLFSVEGADGLLDLPTVNVTRGGMRYPVSPSIAPVMTAPWLWTEANDIDAEPDGTPTKPCFKIPCPSFVEERLDAHGICVTHGNLSDRAYPELTRRYISLVTTAHLHVMSSRHIAALVADSTAPPTLTTYAEDGATTAVLEAIELQAIDYRLKYRMSDNAVLEAVFPTWIRAVMRADLSRRLGVDMISVTDAMILAWFDQRQVRAQFVQDWQVGTAGGAGTATPGGATIITRWPATVDFLLFAAGTFVLGNGGEIDLGVVRDSRLNATNDFTAAWSEEFHLVAKRGHESRRVRVNICANGAANSGFAWECAAAVA